MKLFKHNFKTSTAWLSSTSSSIVGTMVGIILTLGTNSYFNYRQQQRIEHTAVLMVISNMDDYIFKLQNNIDNVSKVDSAITVIASTDSDKLDAIPKEKMKDFMNYMGSCDVTFFDKSSEKIFTSGISTWENIDNPEFITNVGKCYSLIEHILRVYEKLDNEKNHIIKSFFCLYNIKKINEKNFLKAMMESKEAQWFFFQHHNYYTHLLQLELSILKRQNAKNKSLMGITKEEYDAFKTHSEFLNYPI